MVACRLVPKSSANDGGGSSSNGPGGFWVGTYHMPCAYWAPRIMTVHVSLALQNIQRLAAGSHGKEGENEGRDSKLTKSKSAASTGATKRSAAAGTPYILAGDFNIQPGVPAYTLATTGSFDAHTEGKVGEDRENAVRHFRYLV